MSSNFFLSTINKTYSNNNKKEEKEDGEELPSQKYSTLVALYTAMTNQTIKTYFKHLNKKDPITKVKALDNILKSLKSEVPVDELTWSLPDWVITFATLSFDDSHEVRKKTHMVQELIIDIVGMKNMESYVENMLGYWLCGMFDVDTNVAAAARSSFKKAYKNSKKQATLISKYEATILNHLIGNFNTTIKKLGNNRDEAKSRYQRLISSSIHTFKLIVTVNPNMDNPTMNNILGNKLFWKFLTIKKFSIIRAAAYQLISTVCEKGPQLIQPHLNILTPLVLSCFSEKDPLVHQYIVEGLTRYLNAFSKECWQYVDVWKEVFPKLWIFLAEPYHSSPYHTYETLLPFISMINSDVLQSNARSCQFVDQFFSNMWNGFVAKQNHRRDLIPIIKGYSECLTFVVVQHQQFLKDPDTQQVESLLTNLFSNYLMKPYELLLNGEHEEKPAIPIHQYKEEFIKAISLPLSRFVRKPNLVEHVKEFLVNVIELIKTSTTKDNNVNIHDLLSHVIEDNEGSLLWKSFINPLFYDWMNIKNYAGAALLAELNDMSLILEKNQLSTFFEEHIMTPIKQMQEDNFEIDLENLLLIVACLWSTFPKSIENQYNELIKYLGNADLLHSIVNISSFVITNVPKEEQSQLVELKKCILKHMRTLENDHEEALKHVSLVESITLFVTDLIENELFQHDDEFMEAFIRSFTKIIHTFNFAPLKTRRLQAKIMLQWVSLLPVLDGITPMMKEKDYFLDFSWNVYRLAFSEDPMDIGYVNQKFVNTCLNTKVINLEDWVEIFTTPKDNQKFSSLHILEELSEGFFSNIPDDMVIEEHTKILKSTRPSTLEIQHEIINRAMGWNHKHCIKELILNRRLWKSLKHGFLNSVLSFKASPQDVILVPNIDIKKHPKHQLRKLERFEFIMRYGRWLQFVCEYLVGIPSEERREIILSGGSILKHSWILASIAKAFQYSYLFHKTVRQQLFDVMNLLISDMLNLYSIESEKWVSMIQDGIRQFAFKRYILIEFIRQFVTFLDTHQNQHVAQKIMQKLFCSIWELYWFNNDFNQMLANEELLVTNKYLIEGWFSSISRGQLEPLKKFVQNNDTYYDQIVDSMSQSVSLLLFYSQSIKNMQPDKVHALLNYQYSITLLNHYIAPTADDEIEFTVGVLFRYLADLIHAIIESKDTSYLVHSEQILCDISHHLYVTAENQSKDLKSKDHLQFLLQFIEMNFTALTSLEGQSLADLHQRLSSFSPMLSLFDRVVRYHLKDSALHIDLFMPLYSKLIDVWQQFLEYETKHFNDPVLDHFVMYDIIAKVSNQCSKVLCDMHPDIFNMFVSDKLIYSLCTYLKHSSNHVKVCSAMLLSKNRSIVNIVNNLSQFRSNVDYNKYFSEQDDAQPFYDEDESSLVTDDILLAPFQVVMNNPPESALISKFHTKTILSFHDQMNIDSLLSYLCSWYVLFELSSKSNVQDRSYIARYIKAKNNYQNLLNVLFAFVLHDPEDDKERTHEHQLFSRDVPEMDSIRTRRSIAYVMKTNNTNLGIFSCHLIYKMIVTFSGIVRYWIKDQNIVNRSIQPSITTFIGTVLCGSLIRAELDFINERKAFLHDDVEIVVNTATRRVRVTYVRDDMGLTIVITIPQTYPLERLVIKNDSKSKIAAKLSQKWVASMTNSLFSLDGNIMDSIETWIKNLDRHFEGVEPCPICYSIIHGSTYSIPKVKCTVCKNKFHASCLVKWFTTSGKNSCPMCRSLNKFKRV